MDENFGCLTMIGIVLGIAGLLWLCSGTFSENWEQRKRDFYARCEAGDTFQMGKERAAECSAYLLTLKVKEKEGE